ncbi:hypothetical protein ATY81_00580 [Rhizobium sp. R72]|uniref:hypothetical protein n=1 Tax=unclassified Rhizobium TaxID=2613769 RepID=UPI000B530715|nr:MULTISPECIES: hypothetical protein [unclassified Rhizobium]OWW04524.1 hypothetical protein ATY81_00580 [Rhizobium sp. R72]OWW05581.1 hypothetical protein ATY80_00580 [Rhizobium sp. R711]
MLSADRDSKRGGERFAIPTQGEVEGKLLVSEIVAVACLEEFMKRQDAAAIARIRRRVLCNLEDGCQGLKLCATDKKSVVEYAEQILKCAVSKAGAPGL